MMVVTIDINLDTLDTKVIEEANASIKNDIAAMAHIIMEEGYESFAAIVAEDILEEASDTSFTLDNHYFAPFNIRRVLVISAAKCEYSFCHSLALVYHYFVQYNFKVVMGSVYQYYLP